MIARRAFALGCLALLAASAGAETVGRKIADQNKSKYIYFPHTQMKAVVRDIDDGDSISVDLYDKDYPDQIYAAGENIRMTGMDAPETHVLVYLMRGGSYKLFSYEQEGGSDAKEYMKSLIAVGDEVTLMVADPSHIRRAKPRVEYQTLAHAQRDRYGRLLGYVFASAQSEKPNAFVQAEMARGGQAYFYHYEEEDRDTSDMGTFPEKYAEQVRQAAISARKKGLGVWAPLKNGKQRLYPHEFRALVQQRPIRGYAGDPDSKLFTSLANVRVLARNSGGIAYFTDFSSAIAQGYKYRAADTAGTVYALPGEITDLASFKQIEKPPADENPPKVDPGSGRVKPVVPASIVRILDGDTVEVAVDRASFGLGPYQDNLFTVRMNGIDTPESVFRANAIQPGGKEAGKHLADVMGVTLVPEDKYRPDQRKRGYFVRKGSTDFSRTTSVAGTLKLGPDRVFDENGRIVAEVFIAGKSGAEHKISLNYNQVFDGVAWPVFYFDSQFDWAKWVTYRGAFLEAAQEGRGLFSKQGMHDFGIHETPGQFRLRLSGRAPSRICGLIEENEAGKPKITVYPPTAIDRLIPRAEKVLGGSGMKNDPASLEKLLEVRKGMPNVIQFDSERQLFEARRQSPQTFVYSKEFSAILLDLP